MNWFAESVGMLIFSLVSLFFFKIPILDAFFSFRKFEIPLMVEYLELNTIVYRYR